MEVSVIIVNYNTFHLTCRCIASVSEKTKNINFEIILVDNASNDVKPEEFKRLFPQINLVKSEINLGFAKGNNLGISHASGEYILLLNSDTELVNDAISLSFERYKSDSQIGALACRLLYPDGTSQGNAERFPSLKRELRELMRVNKFMLKEQRAFYYLGNEWDYNNPIEADWIWGTFFMFRAEILSRLPDKMLPDAFFMYGEDILWCYEIKRLGYKIFYYPQVVIIHYGGASLPLEEGDYKYYSRILPNTYKVVSIMHNKLYAWLLYFVKALHLLSLHNKIDFQKAIKYFKFLFGEKD